MTTWLFEPTVTDPTPGDVLDVAFRFEGNVTVCALAGRLCAYTAPTLDAWLLQLLENDRRTVVVDGSGLASLSSDGVDVLVANAERFRSAGGRILVRSLSPAARRVLEICGSDDLVER